MRLKGKLSINRYRRDFVNVMEVVVEDENSGSVFLRAEISPEDLMLALTQVGNLPCTFYLGACEYVGKQSEHKTMYVAGVEHVKPEDWEAYFAEKVAPYEVDGWRARNEGSYNIHRRTKQGYEVWFARHVGEGIGYEKVSR